MGGRFESPAVTTVSTALTDIIELEVNGGPLELTFEVANAAGSATLNGFAVLVKTHEGGSWQTYVNSWASIGADYPVKWVTTTTPALVAASGTGAARIDMGPFRHIKLQASVAATSATVTVRGTVATR